LVRWYVLPITESAVDLALVPTEIPRRFSLETFHFGQSPATVRLSYVCRLVRLTLLAPEIVERILEGRTTAGLARFLKPFSVEWERQHEQFC
jgi:hypothetical protein